MIKPLSICLPKYNTLLCFLQGLAGKKNPPGKFTGGIAVHTLLAYRIGKLYSPSHSEVQKRLALTSTSSS